MSACSKYVVLCDAELEAADFATTHDTRVAHVIQAYRYARLAVEAGTKERSCVVQLRR